MSRRVILVTGANGGLGQAIARAFVSESPQNFVWLGVHRNRQQADTLARQFVEQCRCTSLDVRDPKAWANAVGEIISEHGRLDVLVNNAGSHKDALLASMTADAWHEVVSTNLDSVFHGCQAVLPTMIGQRHGRIINIASRGGLIVGPSLSAYCVAKATVIRLTEHVDAEAKDAGVRAFGVQPGTILTDMARDSIADPDAQRWVPFLVNDLKAISHQDPELELQRLARQVAALAAGRYDELAGAYLDLEDGRVA